MAERGYTRDDVKRCLLEAPGSLFNRQLGYQGDANPPSHSLRMREPSTYKPLILVLVSGLEPPTY